MTSTASNSAIDICARALILIGAEPITSFDDGTTESLVAVNMYEDIARTNLCSSRWRFATEQKQVSELTEEPTGRFDRAHQLPSDLLMLHALTVNDIVFEYQVYGDKVFSNASSNEVVIADYTFRALEIGWPSYFTIAVEYAMAAVFAGSIARDPNLIQLMEDKYDIAMRKARSLDSQQQTSRKLATSRFAAERRS
tara:strand:- start:668 stop:1255 length:588 start_codon:yes stop_codon:yes gene_type:complete